MEEDIARFKLKVGTGRHQRRRKRRARRQARNAAVLKNTTVDNGNDESLDNETNEKLGSQLKAGASEAQELKAETAGPDEILVDFAGAGLSLTTTRGFQAARLRVKNAGEDEDGFVHVFPRPGQIMYPTL